MGHLSGLNKSRAFCATGRGPTRCRDSPVHRDSTVNDALEELFAEIRKEQQPGTGHVFLFARGEQDLNRLQKEDLWFQRFLYRQMVQRQL